MHEGDTLLILLLYQRDNQKEVKYVKVETRSVDKNPIEDGPIAQ